MPCPTDATDTAPLLHRNERSEAARERVRPALGAFFGCPVFLRAYKQQGKLELWVQQNGAWGLLKTYPILAHSGELGPKTAEGDRQVPEGFYEVTPQALHPSSKYHLAFNIGYPNAEDRALGRSGSFIMIHGGHSSVGCLAMGDEAIEEIYTLTAEALSTRPQQPVPVHLYPFPLTSQQLAAHARSPHFPFWQTLAAAAALRTPAGIPLPTE